VSAAEKGRRAFTAAELVAFVLVLNRPVETLLTPPESATTVELGGDPVPADVLRWFAPAARRDELEALIDTLTQLRTQVPTIVTSAKIVEALLDSAGSALWGVARGLGLDATGSLLTDVPPAQSDL
jgi:hypothetical protein